MIPYIPAAIQGVSSLANFLTRKKRPKYESTAEAKALQKLADEGAISPEERSRIMMAISRTAGNQASIERTRTKGNLIASGMNNSIAGTRALAEPGQVVTEVKGNAAADINAQNARTKSDAALQLATRKTAYNEGKRTEEGAARQGLISGLAGAGMSAWQAGQDPELYHAGQYGSAGVYELTRQRDRIAAGQDNMRPELPGDFANWTEAQVRQYAHRMQYDPDELIDLWTSMPTGGQ
jgi:hypothetical protein